MLAHRPGMTSQSTPPARCWRLRPRPGACSIDISLVTVLCSSTAAAVDETYSFTSWIAFLMEVSASTTSAEMPFRLPISLLDLVGRLLGLIGEVLDLGGDHGKAAAGLAGTRRFDGGVERQQVDLAGDVADQLHDAAHRLRRRAQTLRLLIGVLDPLDGRQRGILRFHHRLGDLPHRGVQLLGSGRDRLHHAAHAFRSSSARAPAPWCRRRISPPCTACRSGRGSDCRRPGSRSPGRPCRGARIFARLEFAAVQVCPERAIGSLSRSSDGTNML